MSWRVFYFASEHNYTSLENPSSVNVINKLKLPWRAFLIMSRTTLAHPAIGLAAPTLSTCYLHMCYSHAAFLLVSLHVLSGGS